MTGNQIVYEHEPTHFRALDTGLDIPRSGKFELIEIISRPRTRSEKEAIYGSLCRELAAACDMLASDIMVSFVTNADEDWPFGQGRAQFLTGEL